MNIQFKKGVLALCVLALLERRDHYGYELVQQISKNIDVSEGSIYPLLRRLNKEGYFSTYLQESTEGPPRKYYCLTKRGKDYSRALREEWRKFSDGVERVLEGKSDNE